MISALYIRKDSIYKTLLTDCWDQERDARLWPGGNPCIVHPPCGQWSRLSTFAKVNEEEKALSILAIHQVRTNGGILEHPHSSKLWKEMQLPAVGKKDEHGGYTISVDQHWWGHPATKRTLLYICGVKEKELPPVPLNFDAIEYTIQSSIKKKSGRRTMKELPKSRRDITPPDFARWLIAAAEKINIFELSEA